MMIWRAAVLTAAAESITAGTDAGRAGTLLGVAATLASIVLPGPIIRTSLKEAAMPVPVRDTPLGRELYAEGRDEGRAEGRAALQRLTALTLRLRFGDDTRIEATADRLAALPDDERLTRLAAAANLDELER